MIRTRPLGVALTLSAAVLAVGLSPAVEQEPAPPRDNFQKHVLPFFERYCLDCHNRDAAEAKIALDGYADGASALKDGTTWLRVLKAVEGRLMPPADMPQPTAEERSAVVAWIEDDYLPARCGEGNRPGPVVLRRLNRQEYDNTIRDLLGLDLHLAEAFPADEIGFGFDNVGSALSVSPVHIEKYLDAAELAADAAIRLPDAEGMPPIELIGLKTYPLPPDKPVEFDHTLKPGRYLADFSLVRVGVAESVPPPRVTVGFGTDSRSIDAARVQDETVVYRFWIDVHPGDKTVSVALAPEQPKRTPAGKDAKVTDNVSGDQRYGSNRGLHVDSLVVHGPVRLEPEALPPSHRAILGPDPEPGDAARLIAARQAIGRFAERAFRRPLAAEELDRLLAVYRLAMERGESFERGVQVALTAALASPRFLYLVEPEDGPAADRPLTDFELASRLSYFLWSSLPDNELFADARRGTLRANLRRQVERMLADPKADALVANFAGQWLQLRRLGIATPDAEKFPGFNDSLRESMRRETELCVAHVLRNNRSVLELLDADYTFLNGPLARHYGIDGIDGDAFRPVTLADRRRGGVLTQASVLTLTSNPNRTSPVKRGQWVLQQLLGTPPPPPPPDVPKLDDGAKAAEAASLRERLEAHRANPACATCHNQMDPLGFALENYDAVGRWRNADGSFPIDASGELAGGVQFSGAGDLKQYLAGPGAKKFTRCLAENLFTYAMGRGLEPADYCTVEAARKRLLADGCRAQTLILAIVESEAFQHRGAAR